MSRLGILFSALFFFTAAVFLSAEEEKFRFRTETASLEIAADGTVASFKTADGTDLIPNETHPSFAYLRKTRDIQFPAAAVEKISDGILSVRFDTDQGTISAQFRIEPADLYFTIEVLNVEGGDWYGLTFAEMPIAKTAQDKYGVTVISMAPGSVPVSMPGETRMPGGKTYSATFSDGAKIALITAKKSELRTALQKAASAIQKGVMPISPAGGPWAADAEKNHGNYIIHAEPIALTEAQDWITHLKKYGVDQIDMHQGRIFRQGDFVYNPEVYPNGTADFRRLTDTFRTSGIITGLHTYSEFIDPASKYITPVPHPDLDVLRTFTLSENLSIDSTEFTVNESTADVSLLTGFMEKNSLYLRIDNELIKFGGRTTEPPYRFTECERGALGTVKTTHSAGAKADHLTHVYSLFAPKVGSPLFYEIARETARAYNEGGYSMIYLDALDGTGDITEDHELIWYYQTKFVNEIIQNCKEPPLIEYSTMDNNIWLARSRAGAMDTPYRGFRNFYIEHFRRNAEAADASFLPGQIGWLALAPASGDTIPGFQKGTVFPEDIHFLGAKLLAHNYGYSILDAYLGYAAPAAESCGAVLARYEKLKREHSLSPELLEKMKENDFDVILVPDAAGNDIPTPVCYESADLRPSSNEAEWHNMGDSQLPYIRIENKYAIDASSENRISLFKAEDGETIESGKEIQFDPPLDLSAQMGLALEICGDESGDRINVQLFSPHHLLSGHLDHIAPLDFSGWKTLKFAEPDNGKDEPDPSWKECRNLYSEYREVVHYNAVSEIRILGSEGKTLKVRSLDAVPLRPYILAYPELEFSGKKIRFEGGIPSGHYLEYDPQTGNPDEARVLNPTGAEFSRIPVTRDFDTLPAGPNKFKFSAKDWDPEGHVKITVRGIKTDN